LTEGAVFKTAEVRWFCVGDAPTEVKQWFASGLDQPSAAPAAREDVYLSLPDCPYLSIKLREERLEIKLRQQRLGELQVSGATGIAEQWGKWSCADPAAVPLLPEEAIATGPWLRVVKRRWQRRYQPSPQQVPVAVPLGSELQQGCTVELTHLTLQQGAWWSLAFEAFGPEAALPDLLQTTVQWVLRSYPGPSLQVHESYAYPTWLAQFSP
jgi:hypothetical protein